MSNFLSEIASVKSTLNNVKISWADLNKIQNAILKEQNLNNLNELRDKFEGVAYYESIHKKTAGILALEKILKSKFINWETIKPKQYKPIIEIFDQRIHIITTKFGDFPVLPPNINTPIILTIVKEERSIWVIGLLSPQDFEHANQFNKYIPFKSLEELKNALDYIS